MSDSNQLIGIHDRIFVKLHCLLDLFLYGKMLEIGSNRAIDQSHCSCHVINVPAMPPHHIKLVSRPYFISHFCLYLSSRYRQIHFIVAFKILTSSILLGVSPLCVTSFPGRCSTQKKKCKATDHCLWGKGGMFDLTF